MRTTWLAIGVVVLVLLMAGCAMHESRPPEQLINEGKRTTLAGEGIAIDLLPADVIASVNRSGKGVFLQCSGGYSWAGHVEVPLNSGVDGEQVRRSLARSAGDHGLDVERGGLLSGGHFYTLTLATGVQLFVGLDENDTVLDIASFSPCIALPDGYIPPRRF